MDEWFSMMISAGGQLPALAAKELRDAGLVVIPGPVAAERLPQFAIRSGNGADMKVARTTTRMYDFVNLSAEFDRVRGHATDHRFYLRPGYREICC